MEGELPTLLGQELADARHGGRSTRRLSSVSLSPHVKERLHAGNLLVVNGRLWFGSVLSALGIPKTRQIWWNPPVCSRATLDGKQPLVQLAEQGPENRFLVVSGTAASERVGPLDAIVDVEPHDTTDVVRDGRLDIQSAAHLLSKARLAPEPGRVAERATFRRHGEAQAKPSTRSSSAAILNGFLTNAA